MFFAKGDNGGLLLWLFVYYLSSYYDYYFLPPSPIINLLWSSSSLFYSLGIRDGLEVADGIIWPSDTEGCEKDILLAAFGDEQAELYVVPPLVLVPVVVGEPPP